MINWLHSFHPQAVLLSFGPISVHWYGLFMVGGIVAALIVGLKICPYYKIRKEDYFDLAFWLIIGGLIGARLYDDCLQAGYYLDHPSEIFKVWNGGLAIHGALIGGLIAGAVFACRRRLSLASLAAATMPGLALGQAIGRWGNYFNQEIFGRPTSLPWGIPIDPIDRPEAYASYSYFQPTFLYESLGCLIIFFFLYIYIIRKRRNNSLEKSAIRIIAAYMISYSLLRFSLEFIRLDETPAISGWRWPQIISLLMIGAGIIMLIYDRYAQKRRCQKS